MMSKTRSIILSVLMLIILLALPATFAKEEYRITSATVKLGEDLSLLYVTNIEDSFTNYTAKFTISGRTADAVVMSDGRYVMIECRGIAPQEMWSELKLSVNKKSTGQTVCTLNRSFAEICKQFLEYDGLDAKVYRTISDIIRYGASSSHYKNTAESFAEIKSLPHYQTCETVQNFVDNYTARVAKTVSVSGSQQHLKLKGRSIWFDMQNRYYFRFDADDISKVRFYIIVNGTPLNYNSFKKDNSGYYYIYTEPVRANYLLSPATIVGYYNDVEELRFQYSALYYNNDVNKSSTATEISKDLAKSLCMYGYNSVKYITVPGKDFDYDDFAQMTYDMDMDLLLPGTPSLAVFLARYSTGTKKYEAKQIKAATVPTGCSMTNTDFNTQAYTLTFEGENDTALTLNDSVMHSSGASNIIMRPIGSAGSFMGIKINNSTIEGVKLIGTGSSKNTFRLVTPVGTTSLIKDCAFDVTGDYKMLQVIGCGFGASVHLSGGNMYIDAKYTAGANGIFSMDGGTIDGLVMDMTVENTSTTVAGYSCGIYFLTGLDSSIKNSGISLKDTSRLTVARALSLNPVDKNRYIEINNCKIVADSHYLMDLANSSFGAYAQGIYICYRKADIIDTSAKGNHCGMQVCGSSTSIRNCVAEGTSHGGIYFASPSFSDAGTIKVLDSKLAHINHYGVAADDVLDEYYGGDNQASFYIGGSTGSNITVAMDGCNIIGAESYLCVLRDTSGEHDNKLYMSNCQVEQIGGYYRIDNDTMRVYFGTGMDVSPADKVYFNHSLYNSFTEAGIVGTIVNFTTSSYRN